jgi:recombination protein RecR
MYFILGGTVSGLKKENIEKLRIKELEDRVKNPKIKEIILALNPTSEGDATSLYIERLLQKNLPTGRQATRLGRGIPTGGELEYADEETLISALEGRK